MSLTIRALCRPAVLVGLASLLAPGATLARQAPTPASPPAAVRVGDAAPDFTLSYLVAKPDGGFESRQVTLSTFKGKQNVVLAFFPAAFSPG